MSKKDDKKMYGNTDTYASFDEDILFPENEETLEPKTRKGTLQNAVLANIRKLPTRESKMIELVQKGNEFEILEVADDWTKINFQGKIGWLMSKYVKELL